MFDTAVLIVLFQGAIQTSAFAAARPTIYILRHEVESSTLSIISLSRPLLNKADLERYVLQGRFVSTQIDSTNTDLWNNGGCTGNGKSYL